ncbi:MAG: hypothetical protein EXQ53_07355 [Acidobacteria bacterium]|nr:hypothetical protein [Acidobacteriota bacterium]
MLTRRVVSIVAVLTVLVPAVTVAQTWNSPGMTAEEFKTAQQPGAGAAPRRDLSGTWDAGGAGIGGAGQAAERDAARSPLTPLGEQMLQRNKPGNGPRTSPVAEINDPLSTLGDPTGFPRLLTFELRPFHVVQTPSQMLMLYMFEKRWRVIWTDGRQLPKDPDPRWYGYSVGRWEDDSTFVVETVGTDERTWLDNSGHPHSTALRVEERYRRVNRNSLELTVTIDDPQVYTRPWLARNKLPLKLMPPNVDLMEMIPSASEAAAYRDYISSQTKVQ